jgi:hypothetical protein
VSDAECASPLLCMPMTFGGATEVGSFCLWPQAASGTGAPNGDCTTVRQYFSTETAWTSLDGNGPVAVCKPGTTTCPGLLDYRSTACSAADTTGNGMCGTAGVDDGVCAQAGPSTYLCTYPCNSDRDCLNIDSKPEAYDECQTPTPGAPKICVFE